MLMQTSVIQVLNFLDWCSNFLFISLVFFQSVFCSNIWEISLGLSTNSLYQAGWRGRQGSQGNDGRQRGRETAPIALGEGSALGGGTLLSLLTSFLKI